MHKCIDVGLGDNAGEANRTRISKVSNLRVGARQSAQALPIAAAMNQSNSFRNQPDERGHFGQFGGRYVAETLMPLILDLEKEYRKAQADPEFAREFDDLMKHYVGRPSPLYFAERLTEALGGA